MRATCKGALTKGEGARPSPLFFRKSLAEFAACGRQINGFPRRFAPRNDKLGGLAPMNLYRKTCRCARRSVSAATDAIGAYRFIDGRYESEVPPRDCHVGRWPPRNDNLEAVSDLAHELHTVIANADGAGLSGREIHRVH